MKIILCEGKTERDLVYHLNDDIKSNFEIKRLKKISDSPFEIIDNVYMVDLGGKDNLKNSIEKLIKFLKGKKVSKISFIMDADDNYNARECSIKSNFQKIIDAGIDCDYQYYILPYNDGSLGMAEDLILKTLKAENLVKVIESDIYPRLNDHEDSNITNSSKTKFMIFGSTQKPQTASPSFMMSRSKTRDLIDLDSNQYDDLKKFIKNSIT